MAGRCRLRFFQPDYSSADLSATSTITDFDLTASYGLPLNASSHLKAAVLVSVILHAVVLFGISFKLPISKIVTAATPLEVVLVNNKPIAQPVKEEALPRAALGVPARGGDMGSSGPAQPLFPSAPRHGTATGTPPRTASASAIVPGIASNTTPVTPEAEQPEYEAQQPMGTVDNDGDQSVYQADSASAQPGQSQNQNRIFNTADLVQRGLAIARVAAQQGGDFGAYQKPIKRKFIGIRTKDYRFARYAEDWRLKVERIGNLNYPETAKREQLYGSLQLTVGIKSDGSLESIEINRPSGKKVLDEAAVRIVKLAGQNGFAPFPPDISGDIDVLHITRTWVFTSADQLTSE